jgi:hypothetical protein
LPESLFRIILSSEILRVSERTIIARMRNVLLSSLQKMAIAMKNK